MLKQLVFHTGIPKTGSSAIQVFLARNREALLKNDVDYFDIGEIGLAARGRISSGNGALLARSLFAETAGTRAKDPERHVQDFLAAASRATAATGLVSSEMFTLVDTDRLCGLLDALRSMDIVPRVFYYVRSQVQFLSSSYVQQVKRHGCTELPDDYVRRTYRKISYLNYDQHYRNLERIFGAGNVIARSYDEAILQSGGIFHALIAALKIDPGGLDFGTADVNTGMPAKQIAIMLLLNQLKPLMNFSDLVVENAARLGQANSGDTHELLSGALVAEIEDYFSAQNRIFAAACFGRETLFPAARPAAGVARISLADLTSADMVAFFGGLLVGYHDRLTRLETGLRDLRRKTDPP